MKTVLSQSKLIRLIRFFYKQKGLPFLNPKSLIITFFLFPELDSIKNITMFKKLPDHFKKTQSRLFGRVFFIASLTVLCDPAAAEYSPGAEDGCSARFRTLRSLKPIGYSCIHWVWCSILLIAAGVLMYNKFEIRLFAPPPFLIYIFSPNEIYYNEGMRAASETFLLEILYILRYLGKK